MTYEPTMFELFAGQRGFSLAFESEGFRTVGVSEIERWANVVGAYHFPDVPNFGDCTAPGFSERVLAACGPIDVLTGGVPCQPASTLGKRLGTADERWLWADAIRILGELRPSYAIFENPPALLTLESGRAYNGIVSGMAALGYDCMWEPIPAAIFGAGHLRWRVAIIAADSRHPTTPQERQCQRDKMGREQFGGQFCCRDAADSQGGQAHDGGRRKLADPKQRGEGEHEAVSLGGHASDRERESGRPGPELQRSRIRGRLGNEDAPTIANGSSQPKRISSNETDAQPRGRDARIEPAGDDKHLADLRGRVNRADWWHETHTGIPVLAYGLPNKLVEAATRCCGNAVVPQAWRPIARAIYQQIESLTV